MTDAYCVPQDSTTHRTCGTCGLRKEFKEFYKDGKDSHGKTKYRRDCKECYKRTRMRGGKR